MRTHGAFISARYSTDNQNPDSIEVQVAKCTEWCQQHQLPILGIYADMAISGMKDTRPQFEAMMRDLQLGLADTVVIYDQSRMFRKMSAWFTFRDDLTRMGVSVVSVTQPSIGGDLRDPMNFLSEGSMALFNQIWSLQSRQKTMEKMRFMARNGQHTGGKPALGYQVVDGRLAIQPEEAEIVRRIFQEYADGRSYREIIAGLNADGLKTKRGNAFGNNSLHDLLKNEKYIGVLVYGAVPYREDGTRNSHAAPSENTIRIENALPPIISQELFDKVQARMSANRRQQAGRPPKNRDYPLKGKVFCASCGAAMSVGISKGGYYYYKCTGKKRLHNCDASPIRVDKLEKLAVQYTRAMLGSPTNVDKLLQILREQAQTIQGGAAARLNALIAEEREVTAKLNNAVDTLLEGFASTALKNKITDLEAQKAKLENDIKQLKNQVDMSMLPETTLRAALEKIMSADCTDPSAILSIIQRVEIGPEEILLWTMCHAAPDGIIDTTRSGVTKIDGTPKGTRTPDLLIRSQSLYPTELSAHRHFTQVPKYNNTTFSKLQVLFSKIFIFQIYFFSARGLLDRISGSIVQSWQLERVKQSI